MIAIIACFLISVLLIFLLIFGKSKETFWHGRRWWGPGWRWGPNWNPNWNRPVIIREKVIVHEPSKDNTNSHEDMHQQ